MGSLLSCETFPPETGRMARAVTQGNISISVTRINTEHHCRVALRVFTSFKGRCMPLCRQTRTAGLRELK